MVVVGDQGEKFVYYRIGETLEDLENQITDLVLELNSQNITHTAQILGIKRTTLIMRLQRRGLRRRTTWVRETPAEPAREE